MVDYNDYINPICVSNFDYCENQWKMFTAMTEEEEQNWKRFLIYYLKKKSKNEKRIICIETKEIFSTLKDLAFYLNKSTFTVREYIKSNKSIYGKHYKYL